MSNYIHDFASLPTKVQEVILSSLYEINKNNGYVDPKIGKDLVAQAVVMMRYSHPNATIVPAPVNVKIDMAKPGAEETAFQQAEAAGSNPNYVDPEIFDPKENNDALDALGYFLETLLGAVKPEQHCGRPECVACNTMFGEVPDESKANKLRFQQIDHKEGIFGPVDIYRSSVNPAVYAVMNRGKTALVESPDIDLLSYQAAVEIVRAHGKEDRSIIG